MKHHSSIQELNGVVNLLTKRVCQLINESNQFELNLRYPDLIHMKIRPYLNATQIVTINSCAEFCRKDLTDNYSFTTRLIIMLHA